MPAIAHLGVGFAAKRIAPGINEVYLIIAAELIEIIFFALVIAGAENMPLPDKPPFSPYSHGLFMGIMWSVIAAALTFLISRNRKTSFIIGALVLSHTILDLIASPKLAFYPTDIKMPIFFNNNLSVGFGLFKHSTLALIAEAGIFLTGLAIYLVTIMKIKKSKSPAR
jgi:hypothetical protein